MTNVNAMWGAHVYSKIIPDKLYMPITALELSTGSPYGQII